jgi:hypothetical protein
LPLRSRRGPAVATARPADTPKPRQPHHRGAGTSARPSTDDYGSAPCQPFGHPDSRGTSMPPAGRASGPTTRIGPSAAGAPPPDPGDSGMPGPDRRPIAHRRQPDRVRPVQVVRPAGRSTWTGRTRPGRAEPARREADRGSRRQGPLWLRERRTLASAGQQPSSAGRRRLMHVLHLSLPPNRKTPRAGHLSRPVTPARRVEVG